MNTLDMIVIAVVSLCMIRGLFRGLSSELASITGVVAGFYGAYLFHPRLAVHFPENFLSQAITEIISFALIFCLVLLLVSLLGKLIRFALGIVLLGWADRLLGAGFGAAKGVLIAAVLLFMITSFYQPATNIVNKSALGGYVASASNLMVEGVSSRWHQDLKSRIKELRDNWKNHKG